MDLQKIEQHLQGQLAHLDELSASPDHIVTFDEYKAIYDTLIALRQAQALERQTHALENIADLLHAFDEFGFPVKNRR